jgi:hypothetical protein
MTTDTKHTEHDDRIPAALQTVCLASNRGEEVNVPPPRNMAFKGRSVSNVLASNRGEEVNVPPPRNMAFKWRSVSNILASNRGEEVNVPPPRNKTFKGCVSKVFSSMLRCKTKKQACEKPVQLLAPIVDEVRQSIIFLFLMHIAFEKTSKPKTHAVFSSCSPQRQYQYPHRNS